MILNSLNIARREWGQNEGKMTGKAKFGGKTGSVEINLNDDACHKLLVVCADAIVDTAKQVAVDIVSETILIETTEPENRPGADGQIDPLVIPFGNQVRVTKKYHREINGRKKKYISQPFKSVGIFLGWRTIQNGKTVNWGHEGCWWEPSKYITAALVAFSPTKNPVYVPIDGIKV